MTQSTASLQAARQEAANLREKLRSERGERDEMLQLAAERGEARALETYSQKSASDAIGGVLPRFFSPEGLDTDAAWERYYKHGGDLFLQGALMSSTGLLTGRESLG